MTTSQNEHSWLPKFILSELLTLRDRVTAIETRMQTWPTSSSSPRTIASKSTLIQYGKLLLRVLLRMAGPLLQPIILAWVGVITSNLSAIVWVAWRLLRGSIGY